MKKALRFAAILVMIVLISILHYKTSADRLYLHEIYQRIYYIPILLAAFWYGPGGGLAAATLTCSIYGYHIHTDWAGHPAYSINQYAEIVLYYAVGIIIGVLSARERRERRQLERTSRDLGVANEQIRETSEQLRRAERLAALGALTAGVAHEIRNPLASIKGAVEILEESIPVGHPQREFLDIVEEEIKRLNSNLTEFLRFASPPKSNLGPASVNEIVQSTTGFLKKTAEEAGVVIIEDLDPSLPPANLDSDQIRQVLFNLILNAIQAMPDGGALSVRTLPRESGEAIAIEIADSGVGMAESELASAFDPFFTTKATGMGLGLSVSSQLIAGHGGNISLRRNPEDGLTAVVELPLAKSSGGSRAG